MRIVVTPRQLSAIVVILAVVFVSLGFMFGYDFHQFNPKIEEIANCTLTCIQQFNNATQNVYISEDLMHAVEQFCFESCGGAWK